MLQRTILLSLPTVRVKKKIEEEMMYATNLSLQEFFVKQISHGIRRCQEPQIDTEFGCKETWVDTSTHGKS